MRWPIRNQIFAPFASVLLVAVASIAVLVAFLAARRSADERIEQLHRVEATLADANFPVAQRVLQQMRGLSGAEFIALDGGGAIVGSTFERPISQSDLPRQLLMIGPPRPLQTFDPIEFAGASYFATVLCRSRPSGVRSLLILYPIRSLRQAQWEAAWPPLAIGSVTIISMLVISAWLSNRLARRIESVRSLFGRIADGRFDHVAARPPVDEIYDLVLSANRLSDRLATMQEQIVRTERLRLLAQLAGGLAHQLRNAIAGARMAVQLHQRRCTSQRQDESLEVALRQLALTEEQVRGLLSVGKPESRPPSPGRMSSILSDIECLIRPAAAHAHVAWECVGVCEAADIAVANAESLRAGLLNVVLNALEAAGNGGHVRLWLDAFRAQLRVHVADSGTGPPERLQSTIFEPFVTSKPEGIGLGLALAQAAAAEHGGSVTWARSGNETVFTMTLAISCSQTPIAEDLDSNTPVSKNSLRTESVERANDKAGMSSRNQFATTSRVP